MSDTRYLPRRQWRHPNWGDRDRANREPAPRHVKREEKPLLTREERNKVVQQFHDLFKK